MSIASTQIAQAASISGVTVSTTGGTATGNINNIVNDSGLATSGSLTSNHAAASNTNSWVAGSFNPTIDFNLNGSYSLAGFSLWNFNGSNNFGVKGVTVQSSTNGNTFTTISGAPTQFAIGANDASESPEQFVFTTSVTASYVRFLVTSSQGAGALPSLSEVKFNGTATAIAVPEPFTILGTLAGLAGGERLKRRLKAINSKSA